MRRLYEMKIRLLSFWQLLPAIFAPLRARPWFAALGLVLLPIFAESVFAQESTKRRLAMVVGNGAYDAMAPLDHATGDARDIATMLEKLGFEVSLLINSDSVTFGSAMDSFTRRAKGVDTVLMYFAGHGFQYAGSNYLVPVDARLADLASALEEAANLEETIAQLATAGSRSIVLLDASQDIPLPPGIQGEALRGLTVTGAPPETLVAFAAQPGTLTSGSYDDENPFTQTLLKHLPTVGQTVSQMMDEVQKGVDTKTNGGQRPWVQSTLNVPFFFAPFRPKSTDIEKISALPAGQRAFLLNIWRSQGAEITNEDLDARIQAEAEKPAPMPQDDQQLTEAVPEALLEKVIMSMTPVRLNPRTDNRRRLVGRDITDLARAMQVELARVGCYRSGIDGTWGRGSQRALQRFKDATEDARIKTLEPSVVTLDILLETEGEICAAPVVRRAPAQAAASTSPSQAPNADPATQAPAAAATPAPPAAGGSRLQRSLGNAFR